MRFLPQTILASTGYLERVDDALFDRLKTARTDQEVADAIKGYSKTEVCDAVRTILSHNPDLLALPLTIARVSGYVCVTRLLAQRILRQPGRHLAEDVQWAKTNA